MVDKKDIQDKVSRLREAEQNLQSFAMQKQNMQIQLAEVENSLKELIGSKEKTYKIVGPIMVELAKEDLEKDLAEKKKLLSFRIENVGEKEKTIKEQFESLQKEVMQNLQG